MLVMWLVLVCLSCVVILFRVVLVVIILLMMLMWCFMMCVGLVIMNVLSRFVSCLVWFSVVCVGLLCIWCRVLMWVGMFNWCVSLWVIFYVWLQLCECRCVGESGIGSSMLGKLFGVVVSVLFNWLVSYVVSGNCV